MKFETLTLAVSILLTFQSVGSCVSFGIGAAAVKLMVSLINSFATCGLTIPATSAVVLMLPERPVNLRKIEGDVTSQAETASVETSETSVEGKEA